MVDLLLVILAIIIDVELAVDVGIFIHLSYIRRTFVSGQVPGEAPAASDFTQPPTGGATGGVVAAVIVSIAVAAVVAGSAIFLFGTPAYLVVMLAVIATMLLIMLGISIHASYLSSSGSAEEPFAPIFPPNFSIISSYGYVPLTDDTLTTRKGWEKAW